jgi:hypothetical protein
MDGNSLKLNFTKVKNYTKQHTSNTPSNSYLKQPTYNNENGGFQLAFCWLMGPCRLHHTPLDKLVDVKHNW